MFFILTCFKYPALRCLVIFSTIFLTTDITLFGWLSPAYCCHPFLNDGDTVANFQSNRTIPESGKFGKLQLTHKLSQHGLDYSGQRDSSAHTSNYLLTFYLPARSDFSEFHPSFQFLIYSFYFWGYYLYLLQ